MDCDDMHDLQDLLFICSSTAESRNESWDHHRLDWKEHITQLQHEGSFSNQYLMNLPTHGKLIQILDSILERV
jgi:hypothetical protein